MGKSASAKQQITEYRMSIHFGLCLSADAIKEIKVDDKTIWAGDSRTSEVISVNLPDVFGGNDSAGGFVGDIYHLKGEPTQLLPPELASKLGESDPANCVSYRRRTTLWFTGPSGNGGALWKKNSPVIAQKVWVKAECAPVAAGLDPSIAMIGDDANPIHMIYECMVDKAFGMGEDPLMIDNTVFNDAAQTIFNEAFGLSLKWTRQTKVETLVQEICDHIQATTFKSPRTGLWNIKLIRADYNINTIPRLTPANATLSDIQQRFWGDVSNEIQVTYTDPITEEDASVTGQDLGSVFSQGAVAESRNYYAIRNANLAYRVAQRDARSSAAPLVAGTAEVDRSEWDAKPADVFLLEGWNDPRLDGLVVRSMSVDYGKPRDTKLRLSILEDVFSLALPPAVDVPGTGWTSPGKAPEPLAAEEIITLPAYFAMSADLQRSAIDLEYPEVLAAVLGYQDDADTSGYQLSSLDDGDWTSHGNKNLVEREVLQTDMPYAAVGRIPAAMIQRPNRGPTLNGFVFMGAGGDTAMEIAKVVSYDSGTDEWVLARGVLDTVPRAWSAGTPLWFVNRGLQIVDEQEVRAEGETVHYKLRSRTSKGLLSIDDAPELTKTLTARPHQPFRPANLKINGTAFADVNVAATDTIALTWSTRNRLLEDGQVLLWTDSSVPPEYYQGTVVTFYDGSTEVYKQWGLWTESGLSLPKSYFAKYANLTVEVSSAREDMGLNSLQAYRAVITGLPNNPAAGPPPAPPTPTEPPAAGPSPAEGAWVATGSMFQSASNSSIPAILISGRRDRMDAEGLVVRYAKNTGNDWVFFQGVLALDDNPKQTSTTSVASGTVYKVEVAYVTGNVLSKWRSLGTVTTGILAADQVGNLTEQMINQSIADMLNLIDENFENIDYILAQVAAALAQLAEIRDQFDVGIPLLAETVIERSLSEDNLTKYVEALTWMPDGKPVQSVVVSNVIRTDDLVETMNILGVKAEDGGSFILNMNKVWFGELGTGAQVLTTIVSDFNDFHSEVVTNYVTNASQTAAMATLTTSLQTFATNGDTAVKSFVVVNYVTYVDMNAAFASWSVTLQATMDTKDNQTKAFVAANYTTLSQVNSAIASYDATIKAWVVNPNSGGNPLAATVSLQATSIANINGELFATYTMYANANGAMAGISILTSSGSVRYSGVIIDADNFLVKSSSYPAVAPLFYDATTGKLFSDTIIARTANIQNLAVNTLKLAHGAVTKGAEAYAGFVSCSPGSETSLVTAGGTTDDGTDNRIWFSGYLNPITFDKTTSASQLDIVTLNLYRNGTQIHSVKAGVAIRLQDLGGGIGRYLIAGGMISFSFTDNTMPTNVNSYTVKADVTSDTPTAPALSTMDLNFMGCER